MAAKPTDNKEMYRRLNQLLHLLSQGECGELLPEDEPRLQALLTEFPDRLKDLGLVARQLEQVWIHRITGRRQDEAAALRLRLDAMRTELSGPKPDLVDGLLVDHILACWLRLQYCELQLAGLPDRPMEDRTKCGREVESASTAFHRAVAAVTSRRPQTRRVRNRKSSAADAVMN